MTEDDGIDPKGILTVHEALHTSYVLLDTWQQHVLDHPAVAHDPKLYGLASTAFEAMHDVYNAIGAMQSPQSREPSTDG